MSPFSNPQISASLSLRCRKTFPLLRVLSHAKPLKLPCADAAQQKLQLISAPVDVASLPCTPHVEDVAVFPVPEHMRREEHAPLTDDDYVRFVGLEELFPGSGLAEVFDSHAKFRTDLRRAARNDMFVPNPKLPDSANEQIKSHRASLMVSWQQSHTGFANLTSLFRSQGVALDGPSFMQGLGGLVSGQDVSGSLIDIVGITGKPVRHSWHQDNGLEGQITVMLGFPPSNMYCGAGVFRYGTREQGCAVDSLPSVPSSGYDVAECWVPVAVAFPFPCPHTNHIPTSG